MRTITSTKPYEAAAKELKDMLFHYVGRKSIVLGLVGGRSAPQLFDELSKLNISWDNIHIFMVDERFVPQDSEESNYRIIKEHLLNTVNIPKDNLHPFEGKVDEYYNELEKYGGKFDIIVLSAGENGHVGALHPNHHSIRDDSKGFIEMDDSPKPPSHRMSASRKLLTLADNCIIFFIGEGKREAYEKFNDEKVTVEECPAKIAFEMKDSVAVTNYIP